MLFVFNVDTGTMITFDINLALESVGTLKEAVERVCGIAIDKQVLLVSGGECLDGCSRVCSYSSGTDTNPIFLFSKLTIESTIPPSPNVDYGSDLELKDEVDQALNMPPSIPTVMTRSHLAQQMCELAKQQSAACEKLVHDQHLQQQGWAAVIANLDDITSAFRTRSENIQTTFKQHVELKTQFNAILESFTNDVDVLSKIPLLPALLDKEESVSTEVPLNLFNWIAARDNQASVEQLAETCKKGLEQFSDALLDSIRVEVTSVLEAASKNELREIKGLEDRLFGLEQLRCDTIKIVQEQTDLAQAFLQNQSRASNLGDTSILPDLCTSHKRQLVVMHRNHQQLRDIRKRCVKAKQELSTNLYHRLKWVMFVESRILEVDSKLVMYHESIKRLQRQLEVISQIHSAPSVYLSAVAEVVRRRTFSQAFLIWANDVASQLCAVHSEEVARRKVFQSQFEGHFLSSLFRGLEDSPPPFATQAPPLFDSELPKLTLDDIENLRSDLPDLALSLSVPDLSQITQFFLNRSITNFKSDMGHPPAASIEERIVEAVTAAGLGSNLDPALLQPAEGCQSMSVNTTHPISSDRGFESETDTEEFEKVGQSPSETKDETELRSTLQDQFKQINSAVDQAVGELRSNMGQLRQWVLCERTELEYLLTKLSSVWNEANERLSQEFELRQASEKREADLEKRLKLLMEENEILASRAEQLENELSAQQQNVQDVTTRHKVEIEAITSRYKLYSQSIDRSCVHEKMESCDTIERTEHNAILHRMRQEMMSQHMAALEEERKKFIREVDSVKLRADADRQAS
ncbi:Autophagy-related protein 11 [Nesidiocoris tenuis]|uniref:Autophagy-related protein 11 n=1 Tax=Nesidiocoris tenuis TaxID=355587 RepID=A0ABN7A7T8_9HEMI|nr:Autophagy-related protein 11 [Nesidiocoris tenuis]